MRHVDKTCVGRYAATKAPMAMEVCVTLSFGGSEIAHTLHHKILNSPMSALQSISLSQDLGNTFMDPKDYNMRLHGQ